MLIIWYLKIKSECCINSLIQQDLVKTIAKKGNFAERNKMKKILGILLSMLLAVSLFACGGGAKNSDAGYYIMDSVKEGDSEISADDLKEFGLTGYVVLNDDGTGVMSVEGEEPADIEWGNGKFKADDEEVEYTIDGDILTVEIEGLTVNYKRSNETPPSK